VPIESYRPNQPPKNREPLGHFFRALGHRALGNDERAAEHLRMGRDQFQRNIGLEPSARTEAGQSSYTSAPPPAARRTLAVPINFEQRYGNRERIPFARQIGEHLLVRFDHPDVVSSFVERQTGVGLLGGHGVELKLGDEQVPLCIEQITGERSWESTSAIVNAGPRTQPPGAHKQRWKFVTEGGVVLDMMAWAHPTENKHFVSGFLTNLNLGRSAAFSTGSDWVSMSDPNKLLALLETIKLDSFYGQNETLTPAESRAVEQRRIQERNARYERYQSSSSGGGGGDTAGGILGSIFSDYARPRPSNTSSGRDTQVHYMDGGGVIITGPEGTRVGGTLPTSGAQRDAFGGNRHFGVNYQR
jgi:hypothetical protein